MKKWLAVALFACVAVAVQAGEGEGKKKGQGGDTTKEQYIAQAKKQAETKGTEFDQAKVEAKFDKMDTNKDGVLSGDEKSQGKAKGKDGQKKEKKAEDAE